MGSSDKPTKSNSEKVVITVDKLKQMIRNNEEDKIDEIDIITTATCGIMSGTMGIFHIPVAEPKSFRKAEKVYLNGVEGYVGPCPNEFLGNVDITIYGTNYTGNYGGGFLFKDLISKKDIVVEVISNGKTYNKTITIDDIPTAKMIGTRNAFKNYVALTNIGDREESIKTIFHRRRLKKGEASFSGCGEINPLQNMKLSSNIKDAEKELLGKKILYNGAEGIILGYGTRHTAEKPNIMVSADIKEMNAHYVGGFITSGGVEIYNTIAIPIEMNKENKEYLKTLDEEIPLNLTDIVGRTLIDTGTYSEVWKDCELRPNVNVERCRMCDVCIAQRLCPTNAIKPIKHLGNRKLPNEDCFGCGVCVEGCPYGIFSMKRNSICGAPITCRQSDRERALKLARDLKRRIEKGEFEL